MTTTTPPVAGHDQKVATRKQFLFGMVLSIVGFGVAVALLVWLEATFDLVHTAEIQFASHSPKGASGGSVIPASCEAAYEHNGEQCQSAPMGSHDRLDCDYIQGWSCDPDNPGARPPVHIYRYDPLVSPSATYVGQAISNEFRPDLPGHPAVCGGFPDGQYQYTFPVPAYAEDGRTVFYYVYALDDSSYRFAGNPLLSNSPRSTSCALPTPTITGWSCVLGPAGERQLRITWNRAPGYPAVYLRTEQNENTAAYVPYAPGTRENYVGDSITFNITPGAEYDFWMHTRKPNGSYSAAVRLDNMVCNNPPPPTNPATQCTYDDATDTFTARVSWNAPSGFDTFYTRVSSAGYGNSALASRLVWDDGYRGTSFTFPANRNLNTQTPRYYWWVHTKDTSNAWWSADVNQTDIAPFTNDYFFCPLPAPRAVTDKDATCTATPWNPTNSARFTMTARFAQWYDVEYENTVTGTPYSLNNVNSGHTANSVPWGRYRYRVRGENQDGGNPVQSGPWSGWDTFECLPPDPVISINATPALVAKGERTDLVWQVQANYNMRCTVSGANTSHTFDHLYNPLVPATLTTTRTAASPFETEPVNNTTDFVISCVPQINTLPNLEATEASVRVEVVPTLEER